VEAAPGEDRIRPAELMAALSLATDLGLGRALEHELGVCLAALEAADRLGCSPEERSDVYYVALLLHVGCTAAAPYFASWVGGDEIRFQSGVQVLGPASEPSEDVRYLVRRLADDRPLPERARLVARQLIGGQKRFELAAANLCEGGRLLARRLHLRAEVARALGQVTARWDGKGVPGDVAEEEISRPLRIVRVAHDFVAVARGRDRDAALKALSRRRGRGYDPRVVDAVLAEPDALMRAAEGPDAFGRVLDAEPPPVATISTAGLEVVARAFGEFVDLKLGFLTGHSSRVAELAATAAEALGCRRDEVSAVRAAGFFHDLGRVAVPNGVWDKPGALSGGEWERVRLHPYYTERVLERSPALARLALLAGSHHERLDGSGYHRGAAAAQLSVGARLLAAADAYDGDDPRAPAPASDASRRRPDRARRDGRRRGAREAGGGRRARGSRCGAAQGAPGPPGGAHGPRGRGPTAHRPGPNKQGDRRGAGDHGEDGGPPRRAHLREGGRLDTRRRCAVRDAPRPGRVATAAKRWGVRPMLGRRSARTVAAIC
jgi:HD-GYP domain-containing protein (c-di-GMP phosphodiesterase class II)